MKTLILIPLLLAACMTTPGTSTTSQGLCTADNPGCGPAGSNPSAASIATTNWVHSTFPTGLIISLDCFVTYDANNHPTGSQCHVTITEANQDWSYGCALWNGDPDLYCGED